MDAASTVFRSDVWQVFVRLDDARHAISAAPNDTEPHPPSPPSGASTSPAHSRVSGRCGVSAITDDRLGLSCRP